MNLNLLAVAALCAALFTSAPLDGNVPTGRIVFLGDSITHDGRYIAILDAYLRQHKGESAPDLINLGYRAKRVLVFPNRITRFRGRTFTSGSNELSPEPGRISSWPAMA